MIAQGTGWQRLRTMSLDAIPLGTRVYHSKAIPLNLWRVKGFFTVASCTKQSVIIEADAVEIGSALLADSEFLLDHAAEHQASIRDSIMVETWRSPAWMLVTIYYWCFFSAMALTRMSGHSAWFLDKTSLAEFKKLAGSSTQPGAGALYLAVQSYVSATIRRVALRPSKSQLHDASWTRTATLIADVFSHCDRNSNIAEYRFWGGLKRVADLWGPDWPSKLRNAVNYRPGYAYREVIRDRDLDPIKYLRNRTPISFDDLVNALENEAAAVRGGTDPSEDTSLASRLLSLYALSLALVNESLHSEVIYRQSGDVRWQALRRAFFGQRCRLADGGLWPFV